MFSKSFKSFFAFTVTISFYRFGLIQFYCLIYMAFSISVRVAKVKQLFSEISLSRGSDCSEATSGLYRKNGRVTVHTSVPREISWFRQVSSSIAAFKVTY